LSGSKKGIEKILFELFYDETSKEFSGATLSRNFILGQINNKYPNTDWTNDVYYIIQKWHRRYDELYDGIYNENKLLLEAGVTDTREICERKFQNGLDLLIDKRIAPIYFDRDTKEWRITKTLKLYEEITGDKIRMYHDLVCKEATNMAKRGANFPSGDDSRKIIFDILKEKDRFQNKIQNKSDKD